MKKTFRMLGIGLLAASVCLFSCNKAEEEEDEEEGGNGGNTEFVSKTPSKKNVLIEEYTGVYCGYCPDGHKIVNGIVANNPGRVFAMNIHDVPNSYYPEYDFTGGYYNTDFGRALCEEFGVGDVGFPSGTMNRNGNASGRGTFSAKTNTELNKDAVANIAAKATINQSSRKLTVTVQVYYTANGTGSSNAINVALLQNNIMGPQNNGQQYNPDQYDAATGKYRHMHMLRHLVTGQWGEQISPITEGSLITKEYTYDIPAKISNVDVVLADLEVLAFVCEGKRNVVNVCEIKPTLK